MNQSGASNVLKIAGIIVGGFFALFTAIWVFTGIHSVPNDSVAVIEYKPYFFGEGRIDDTPVIGPSIVYTWPSTNVVKMKRVPVTINVHAEDFITSNQVPLDFEIAVTIELAEPKLAPALYRVLGVDSLVAFKTLVLQDVEIRGRKTNTGEFMSFLRDQVRHYNSSVFISATNPDGTPSNGAQNVEKETTAHINTFLRSRNAGIIKIVNIALGRANPPKGVLAEIENTAKEAQQARTQAARLIAAQARKDAETASAEADKAYLKALGLTTPEYIELKRIEVIREVCTKTSCTFINGQVPITIPVK
jgi:regulator of protease activity HflC (stomatin/prohibitin superfamily)